MKVGDTVYWTDPEGVSSGEYRIFDIKGEVVCMENGFSEVEAPMREVRTVRKPAARKLNATERNTMARSIDSLRDSVLAQNDEFVMSHAPNTELYQRAQAAYQQVLDAQRQLIQIVGSEDFANAFRNNNNRDMPLHELTCHRSLCYKAMNLTIPDNYNANYGYYSRRHSASISDIEDEIVLLQIEGVANLRERLIEKFVPKLLQETTAAQQTQESQEIVPGVEL